MNSTKGFTLIELMIVVAVMVILAAISVPRLARTIHKAQESSLKANLEVLRGAINQYMADTGTYPKDDLTSLVSGGYINEIPTAHVPPNDNGFQGHDAGNSVGAGPYSAWGGSTGKWYYFNDPNDAWFGKVVINCNHAASDGVPWDQH